MPKITLNENSHISEFTVSVVSPETYASYGKTTYKDTSLDKDTPQLPLIVVDVNQLAQAVADKPERLTFAKQLIHSIDNDDNAGYDDLITITGLALRVLAKKIDSKWMADLCKTTADALFNADYNGK